MNNIDQKCNCPGSNRGPLACEANVITDYTTGALQNIPIASTYIDSTGCFLNSGFCGTLYNNIEVYMPNQTRDYLLVYFRISGCYFWFNIFQIVLTLSMLASLYIEALHAVIVIEIFIAFMVALDLLMRYFSEGFEHFTSNWDNKIHITILTLLVISIASDLIAPEITHHSQGIIAGVFLFIRYSVQISRLLRLIVDSKKQLQLSQHQKINLNETIDEQVNERANQSH